MKKVEQLFYSEITKINKVIDAGDTVIFVGSGISRDSGLPIVSELVPYIFEKFEIPIEDTKLILDSNKNPKIPFEAIIEDIKESSIIESVTGK